MFKKCCFYLCHWSPNIPYVGLGSENQNIVAPDLSSVIDPLQYYLLSLIQDCSCFHTGASIRQCYELLESSGETAFLPKCDPCGIVDFEKSVII